MPAKADPRKILLGSIPNLESQRQDVSWFNACCEWLTTALFKIAPIGSIRDRAIRQAQMEYQKGYPYAIEISGPNKGNMAKF